MILILTDASGGADRSWRGCCDIMIFQPLFGWKWSTRSWSVAGWWTWWMYLINVNLWICLMNVNWAHLGNSSKYSGQTNFCLGIIIDIHRYWKKNGKCQYINIGRSLFFKEKRQKRIFGTLSNEVVQVTSNFF